VGGVNRLMVRQASEDLLQRETTAPEEVA
jgi:hypothetical protein